MEIGIDMLGLGSNITMLIGVMAFAGFGLLAVLFFMYSLNKKYPKVTFHVIEGGVEKRVSQRLMGNKVVPNSLIDILMKGDRLLGEDINTFDYLQSTKGKRIYYAFMRNFILVPMTISQKGVEVGEINKAREIAYRYVNVMKQTREQTAKNEPLITAIISSIPLLIIIIAFGFLIYILLTGSVDSINTAVSGLKEVATMLKEVKGV